MAVKTATTKAIRPLIPPDESIWQRYSPHNEAPLAGATSLFLHGTVLGVLLIGGMAFFWAAREEASKPPKMDVILVEGDGTGLEGGGGAPGLPGSPDAGAPKELKEQVGPLENVKQIDSNSARPPAEKPPELDFRTHEVAQAPLDPDLFLELEKLAKEEADQAKKETAASKTQTPPGPVGKTLGLKGTGNPKGAGGLGGSGGGPGAGNKFGAGAGKGGGFGNATKQQVYAWRWNFSLGNDGKEHARMLAAIGVNVAVQDPQGQVWYITDLNRRPVDKDSMKKGTLPDLKKTVGWANAKPDSVQALARELQLPFVPTRVFMFLPKEREEKMAAEEERFAAQQGRKLATVRRTWFEFQLRNGAYEPAGKRFE